MAIIITFFIMVLFLICMENKEFGISVLCWSKPEKIMFILQKKKLRLPKEIKNVNPLIWLDTKQSWDDDDMGVGVLQA